MSLGLDLGIAQCAHLGRTCGVERNNADKPSKVNIFPCCKYLYCAGIGPYEIKNMAGEGHHSSDTYFTGICTLGLDNDQANNDDDAYISYIKAL